MVRLHVMDDQVVGRPAGERFGQVGLPFLAFAAVGRVEHGDLLVENDIGVIGHALGDDVLALEEVEVEIVDTDELDGCRDIFGHSV